jgi:bifunctional non-homologous end joining protein LigD
VIDGEAVLLGDDGISDFNGLHSRKYDDEVTLYAFDFLISEGEDVRKLPLSMRKTSLARLLASSYPTSSKARSVRTCSATPA